MCLYVTLTLHVYCLQKIVWTPDVSPISSPSVKHQPSSCGTAEPLITAGLATTAGPCIIEEQSIAAKPPVRAVDHSANTVHSLAFSIGILQPSIGEIHRAIDGNAVQLCTVMDVQPDDMSLFLSVLSSGLVTIEELTVEESAVEEVAVEEAAVEEITDVFNIEEQLHSSDGTSTEATVGSRKRKRNEKDWKKNKNKVLHNTGREYVNSRNKTVEAKVFKHVGKSCCKLGCVDRLSEEERREIHSRFWQLGSHSAQTSFIAGCVEETYVKTKKFVSPNLPSKSGKFFQRKFVLSSGDKCVRICKSVFLKTLAISDGRLHRALLNKRENGGVAQGDKRGKHGKQNQISEDLIADVKEHIASFPSNTSHYTRSHSVTRKYLSPNLSINEMYRLYVERCKVNGKQAVKASMYRHIFNTKFNLSFHSPWKDTCKKCDCLKIAIESEADISKKRILEDEHQLHLRKAEAVRSLLQTERDRSVPDVEAFTFDLQKVFSLPSITTGEAFYCRQLSTYNLGIHSLSSDNAIMNIWHEGIASRGPNEIGSCVLLHCQKLAAAGVRKLSVYTDSCGGQNRNKKLALLWLYICQRYGFEEIMHRFMVSGHSFLPNDADFGVIERGKPKSAEIFTMEQWCQQIEKCCKVHPYEVVRMTAENFVTTDKLIRNTNVRKYSMEGDKVKWLNIQCLQVRLQHPHTIFYKYTVNDDCEFSAINVSKNGTKFDIGSAVLTGHDGPRPLSKSKVCDLKKLMKFVPPVHHSFYEDIFSCPVDNAIDMYDDELLYESECEDYHDDVSKGRKNRKKC